MPNYITAAIPKVKNTAASIRGYCNPVSRGSLTLPIGDVMRSVTSAQLGAAVERAAMSLEDRTKQCREDVEEPERAAAMRPAMRQAHQVQAAAIASRGLPADPAHWTRDIIVKFREAMTAEERALNLRLALLEAEKSKTAIRRVEDECEQLRRDLETANQQLAKSQETLADAEEVRLRALNLAAQVGELTVETARLEVDLRKSEARANDKNDTCMELRARLNTVESNLTQAEKELKNSAIRQKAADGEVVRLKGRCDHLYSELYKRLNRDVAAVRSAPEDVDNRLCASQTMASRITGLSIVSLPDDIWKAIDEGLRGLPIPNLPIQPERWTIRSSIKSSSPAMPTVHAACMALILASRSPAAPQEPMLANMCTLLSLGNPATTQLVELALRGISYRDTQMDSRGELVWLVTVAARLASIDIGPMVDGLRQPFRRLVEMSAQHPVTAAGLRYICTNAGALDREAGLGFLEGIDASALVELRDRVVQIVVRRAVMPGRPDEAVNRIETTDGRVVEFTTSDEVTRR